MNDDFICDVTCEEYYNEDWVGWDDDQSRKISQKNFLTNIKKYDIIFIDAYSKFYQVIKMLFLHKSVQNMGVGSGN